MRPLHRWCSLLALIVAAPTPATGQPDVAFYDRVVERVFSTHAGHDYSTVVQYLDERGELQLVVRKASSGGRVLQTIWCSPSVYAQLSNVSATADVEATARLIRCASQDVDPGRAPEVEKVLASADAATVGMSDDDYLILDGIRVRVVVRSTSRSVTVLLDAPRDLARSNEPVVRWAGDLRRALGY